MFVAADYVLGIVCALLTDFETLCACWLWKLLKFFGKFNYTFESSAMIDIE